jgi:tetratricopeptide (TPR) repeat protein
MTNARPLLPAYTALLLLASPGAAAAQKAAFADAFVEFHSSLSGAYGDEGPLATAALDRMAASLEAWEQAARASEAALAARADATPADRALLYVDQHRMDDAVTAMKAAVAAEPGRAALHLFLGHLHAAVGDGEAAAAAFAAASRLDPSDPVAAYLAGVRLAAAGELDAISPLVATLMAAAERGGVSAARPFPVFALLDELSAPTPAFAPAAYVDGFRSMEAGQFRRALEQFRAAAARDPLVSDPAGRLETLRRGVTALRQRNAADAVARTEAAVAALPQSAEAHRVLGIAYRAVGRLAESIDALHTAVTLAPDEERARLTLASALAEAGRLDEAERMLRETIDRLPASGRARWALADLYDRLELDRGIDAIAQLDEAASLPVPAGKVHLYWRIAQLAHGYRRDHAHVIAVLSRRMQLVPNEPHAHKDLGLAYHRAGRDDEALLELLMGARLGYEDAEMLGAMGQSHLNAGRFEAAESVLQRAIALDPDLAQARYALATVLQRLGRAGEAAEHLDAFRRLQQAAFERQRRKFEIETLVHDASRLSAAGRAADAAAVYEKAAALGGPADIYRQLAALYATLGRQEDSRRAQAAYEERRAQEAGLSRP